MHMQHPVLLLGMWLLGVKFQRGLGSCILPSEVLVVMLQALDWSDGFCMGICSCWKTSVSRMQQIHETEVLDSKRRLGG